MSRTRKRPYTKSKRFDASCRNHGGCPWCESNRNHANAKKIISVKEKVVEAAMQWGDTQVDDEVGTLASELGLSMALVELKVARKDGDSTSK